MLKQALIPRKTNMAMEHPPFELMYFPVEKWGFSNVMLVFRGVYNAGLGIYYSNLLRFIEKKQGMIANTILAISFYKPGTLK